MIVKLPMLGSSISPGDMLYAVSRMNDKSAPSEFARAISKYTGLKNIYLVSSGIASFYIILEALKLRSKKKQVILPAYTAGSLVVAVKKAGLEVVLCDISLHDYGPDEGSMLKAISKETLAIVYIHLFGIGTPGIEKLKKIVPPDIFIIEDCAQAMGTEIDGKRVGTFSDVSFFSFNRGKNMPLTTGGLIATDSVNLAKGIERYYMPLTEGRLMQSAIESVVKILAFNLSVLPFVYGSCYSIISRFKETTPPKDFIVRNITHFQSALGAILLNKLDILVSKRYENGMYLINALKDIDRISIPEISSNSRPAFNRFPVLFKDTSKREVAEKRLSCSGIETSRMYLKPLYRMFDLCFKNENFPNADYCAEHLLTLPIHPSVRGKDLDKMIEVMRTV